jgi:ER-bound oxygenase mpaB/B'/Rubber oxygenase, catalytic domain
MNLPTEPELDAWRRHGDPPVDDLLAEILADSPAATPLEAMAILGRDRPTLLGHLADHTALPAWADRAQIERGRRFFSDQALDIMASLFYASLPTAYACGDGAVVVRVTEQLASHTHRRTAETAQFLFDVMEGQDEAVESPFAPASTSYAAITGVRMMHGCVRRFVRHTAAIDATPVTRRFDESRHGVPVNQEDLLGTMLTFSTIVLRALPKAGVNVSAEDAVAYMHLWCVIGSILGIDATLLPLTLAEGETLATRLDERLVRPSASGVELGIALLAEMERTGSMFLGRAGRVTRATHGALIRRFCTPRVVDALGLPPAPVVGALVSAGLAITGPINRFARQVSPLRRLLNRSTKRMLTSYIAQGRGNNRPPFHFGSLVT